MKLEAIGFTAVGVVLGFVLGGVPARRELRAVRAERDAIRTQLDALERPDLLRSLFPALGATAGQPRAPTTAGAAPHTTTPEPARDATRPASDRPAPRGDVAVIGARDDATHELPVRQPSSPDPAPPDVRAQPEAAPPGTPRNPRNRAEFLNRFDDFVAAQRARSAAARAALIEQAGLSQVQLAQVDAAVSRMNEKLAVHGERVVAQVATEKKPSPAQVLGIGHDVSGILYEAQTVLDGTLGEAAESVDASAQQIWNYVDVEQLRPFVEEELKRRAALGTGAAGAGVR